MLKRGEKIGNFVVEESSHVKEIDVTLLKITHAPSGAEIIHVVCDDPENVFALSNRTYPENDTGAAHILEHMVLCGSKNYPISDPFFSMLRRSANTFMNAFTAKTWTCYPASSMIEQDFYNLLAVYIDAVFFPKLTKESFAQEGHHYEFEEAENPDSPLLIKGIVYNEMKGVFSSPSSILYRKLMMGLHPSSPCEYDSGGIPKAITHLTHDELIAFHSKYYHPSRCVYYFYGNINTKKHLTFLEEKLLKDIKKVPPIDPLPLIERFKEQKRETDFYPAQDKDVKGKTYIGFGWLMMNIQSQEDLLALCLIDSVLMDTDASPLKQKLLESGLCTSADTTYDPDVREIPYLLFCMGADSENADKIEECLFSALREIANEGISEELLEASLYQLEFHRSEKGGEGHPYGLDLYFRTALSYQQGGPLVENLKIHSHFEKLAELTKDPKYLSNLIEKYFINNKHMLRLTLAPDPEMGSQEVLEEKQMLDTIQQGLSKEEKKEIIATTKSLQKHHEDKANEDVSCLPILKLQDLPKEVSYFPLHKDIAKELSIYYHDNFTNHIVYTDLVFDVPQIAEEDLPYLQLFSQFMTELGCGGRSYVENLHKIQAVLGSIHAHLSLNIQTKSLHSCLPTFSLSARALSSKMSDMTSLMTDFLLNLDYHEEKRIRELIAQTHTSLVSRFNSSAIGYAIKQSSSSFSTWSYVSNLWHGLPFFNFIKDLAENLEKRIPIIMEKFAHFGKVLFHLNNPQVVFSCDQTDYEKLKDNDFFTLSKFSSASNSFHPWALLPNPKSPSNASVKTSSGVANNALAISTVTIQSSHAAGIKIASFLMENLYIHPIIREQQGAYTCRVRYNIVTGIIHFFSSRDPCVKKSYKAFETAIFAIADGKFGSLDLHEAKLCYAQDVDSPTPPSMKAATTFFQHKIGLTPEVRQAFRKNLFALSKEDVQKAVKECLIPHLKDGVKVSYAPEALLGEVDFPLLS